MCGIVYAPQVQTAWRMVERMVHRGPDGTAGTSPTDDVYMAACVLRVSSDSDFRASQPIYNEGMRYCMVFNGEIYNWKSLRDKYRIRAESDTELLMKLWQDFGAECLTWLRGPFAFVVYDAEYGTVTVVRDRFGVKPLYFRCEETHGLCIASELKAFGGLPNWKPEISSNYMHEFDTLRVDIESDVRTPLVDVYKIPAGCAVTWGSGTGHVVFDRWFEIVPAKLEGDGVVRSLVEQAVAERIETACRPIGLTMSGGLDSSIVAAVAASMGYRLPAYIAFYEGRDNAIAERAVRFARALRHEVRKVLVCPPQNTAEVRSWVYAVEDVFNIWPAQLAVYRAMHEDGVVVSLDGHGADEAFAGYREQVKKGVDDASLHEVSMRLAKGSLQHILRVHDMAAMASGVEVRAPFMSHELLLHGLALSRDEKLHEGYTKYPLRKAFDDLLPKEIAWAQDKQGFYSPRLKWKKRSEELKSLSLTHKRADWPLATILKEEIAKR